MVHKSPTVIPYGDFDAKSDAEELKAAMKGLGTDEATIIAILSKRSNKQRLQIIEAYKSMYGKDLIKHLKRELGGDFERAVIALMTPSEDYLATEVQEAIEGLGTEEGTLVEILAGSTNEDIKHLKASYERLYGKPLEEAIAGDTDGDFKNILIALAQGQRDESTGVDEDKAREDAERLFEAGEGKLGTDESEFVKILCSSSYAHLEAVQRHYWSVSGGTSLKDAVKSEFTGNTEKAMMAVLGCSRNQARYFAGRLQNAMEGVGTRDRSLIRIIVSRSEIDLGQIKSEFHAKYGTTLEEAIEGETSGDFKRLLLALL